MMDNGLRISHNIEYLNQQYFLYKNLKIVAEGKTVKFYVNKPRTGYKILFEGKTYAQVNEYLSSLVQIFKEFKMELTNALY